MPNEKNTYVVTGAAEDGIGDAVIKKLLAMGHEVVGTYEPSLSEKAASLSSTDGLELIEVDHANRSSLNAFCKHLGKKRIHGFVNVQMLFIMEEPEAFSHDDWDRLLAVNLTMPNYLIHELKGNMEQGASIVIVTSTEGFTGSFGASGYASTKAAIHNLVKTQANNLGARKVRVNAVAPGWIGGVMDTDEVFNMSRSITPLGRLGSPAEVADACWYLLSDSSSFVNGTTLVVDGGYSGVDTIAKFEFEAELGKK